MTDLSVTQYNPYNMYQSYGYSYPAFRGATVSNASIPNIPQLRQQPDTVSFSANGQIQAETQKKGLSKEAKWGIGAVAVLGLGALAYVLTKGKAGTKQVQQLAEHIDFSQAKTYEEAVQFGKTHLGIKEYKGFGDKDLDVINWLNEGIVNISNKLKGKSIIPKKVIYEAIDGKTMLEVSSSGEVLRIDKSVFGDIDKAINDYLSDGSYVTFKNGKYSIPEVYSTSSLKPLLQKLEKFIKSPNQCDFKEKIELFENLQVITNETNSFLSNPINRIKAILNNSEAKNRITQIGLEKDIDRISKMSIDEQQDLLMKYIREANIKKPFELTSRFKSIYHEFGHLNDPKLSSRAHVKQFYDTAKEAYPAELNEWLNNTEKQRIAGEVSSYATECPAEFIAETYAKLVEGRKVSDDVMTLYRSYGGPSIS